MSDSKAEIVRIVVRVGAVEVSLTPDEARELRAVLGSVLGGRDVVLTSGLFGACRITQSPEWTWR